MNSIKAKIAAFQESRAGLFVKKVLDDKAPNLAALLAWGTLSAMLPLFLGILTMAGLVLRDPERVNQIYNTVIMVVPETAAAPLTEALDGVRNHAAAPAGVFAILLLLFNGSAFFGNMASVFDQAYHVEGRNFIMQRIVSIVMLIVTTSLLVVSTLALGLGTIVEHVPLLPIGPLLAKVLSWSVTIVSAFVIFLLIYKLLPNAEQGWRNVIPGTLVSLVLFFVIVQLFPLYLAVFPPNQAYAVFGVFLVFTFFLYLLGMVFVLGAELNAFLQEPARSVALAEATAKAEKGHAQFDQESGSVRAESEGRAPALRGASPLGAPAKSPTAQLQEQGQAASKTSEQPEGNKPTLAGRILGFIGLVLAVFLLRGGNKNQPERSTA